MTGSLPVPGAVLRIPEADYKFGLGELHLRVTRVGQMYRESDGIWVEVAGMQLTSSGEDYQARPYVLVRVTRVRA